MKLINNASLKKERSTQTLLEFVWQSCFRSMKKLLHSHTILFSDHAVFSMSLFKPALFTSSAAIKVFHCITRVGRLPLESLR